ncbi:MAG: hypothetical protein JWQ58_2384, partial [Reyranella sp.]|nr:hypothetical protein [Reyranella sp.]
MTITSRFAACAVATFALAGLATSSQAQQTPP